MSGNTNVTLQGNSGSRSFKMQKFLDDARKFNISQQRPFCYKDFAISHSTFRKNIHHLGDCIETVICSKPCFYKVRGVKLPGDIRKVTFRPTGGIAPLNEILESLRDQPPMIHDIKIKISTNIHSTLVAKGCTVSKSNKGILMSVPVSSNNIVAKVSVYPHTTQIDIACSFKPITYDVESMIELLGILKEVSLYITQLSGISLPPVGQWIITHYHFNKDGSVEANGSSFHISVTDTVAGFVRLYTKKLPNNKTITRLEKTVLPNIPLTELMVQVANGDAI